MLKVYDMVISNEMYKEPVLMVWFMGCKIKCGGCFNKHLWDDNSKGGSWYNPLVLSEYILRECETHKIKYVMFSGGEPLDQNLKDLWVLIKSLPALKFLMYTGYDKEDIYNMGRVGVTILESMDCILSGKYKGSDTGLMDKEFLGNSQEAIDYFKEESKKVVVEVRISPTDAKLMGYDTLED